MYPLCSVPGMFAPDLLLHIPCQMPLSDSMMFEASRRFRPPTRQSRYAPAQGNPMQEFDLLSPMIEIIGWLLSGDSGVISD